MILRQKEHLLLRAGFTLLEILVVVAIIVALAGVGGFYIMGQYKESQKSTARLQIKTTLAPAVQIYATRHQGNFPGTLQELLNPDSANGNLPYLKEQEALIDPWGHPYTYQQPGTHNTYEFDIFTTAPDGTTIGNWGR